MLWCLIAPAALCLLMALGALTVNPAQLPTPQLHPGQMVRGCMATLFLLGALLFAGLAWVAIQVPQ